MNYLSQTKTYHFMKTVFREMENKLQTINFLSYRVPTDYYYDLYVEKFKNYTYPLARKVLEDAKKGYIVPIMFAEPYDNKVQAMDSVIPQSLFTFGAMDKTLKTLVCYVDTSMKGKYLRNKINDSIESYKIDEFDLYSFLQSAYIFRFAKMEDSKITQSKVFLKELATCYIILLSKIIDMKLSISANRLDFNILMFLCGCFFFQWFAGYSKERSIELTKQFKFISRDGIEAKCIYYSNDELDFISNESEIKSGIFSIDKFCSICGSQFQLGNKLNHRELATWWSNLYGHQSLTALEDFTSFLLMINLVQIRSGFFNDMAISSALKPHISEIPKLILKME